MPDSADLEQAAWLVCLGQCLRLEPKRSPPSRSKTQQRPFCCCRRAPEGCVHPGTGSPAHLKCGALRAAPPNPTKSPPGAGGPVPGSCLHPLCSGLQPGPSPLCCHAQAGSVSPARPHPVLSPCRSWSGPWSQTARMRSPLLSTPLPPTRARSSAAVTPARRPPRRPGEPPALRRGCTAPSARGGRQSTLCRRPGGLAACQLAPARGIWHQFVRVG